ncbi:hypothetical protein [Rothia nasimurium]|uniref:hypothetical protein n=1 Tax=Rothia nasimurium TaxID=85336 RepID=UPI001F3DBCC1|nr:hypothetical protein [Rothia nasimurium]
MAHPCQICTKPTHAATCPECVSFVETQLTQSVTLIVELRTEAAKTTTKTQGGYTTGQEGQPLGINLGALAVSDRLTRAIGDLGARVGVGSTDPHTVREQVYKLAWAQQDDPAPELVRELAEAVNAATRLVDLAPQIRTHGKCTTCGVFIKAPADRQVHFCTACGTEQNLETVRENLKDLVLDALGGAWFPEMEMPYALELIGYTITGKDVRNWYNRDKLPAGRRRHNDKGAWLYLFDDVLDVAERRAIKQAKRALDSGAILSQAS